MTKKKKTILAIGIIIAVLIAVIGCYKIYPSVELKSALAEKYGWEKSDIIIVSHQNAHYEHDFGFFGLDAMDPPIWRINEKWVCEYKGREFNVEYTDRQFADDYQLEDIFKWCTEWMQENVDPEIVGVVICSDIVYHSSNNKTLYKHKLPWNTQRVFTKADADDLLNAQIEESHGVLNIYYYVKNANEYGTSLPNEPENRLYGNEAYKSFVNNKENSLSFIQDGKVEIQLIDNIAFCRTEYAFGSGGLNESFYSIDYNKSFYVINFPYTN